MMDCLPDEITTNIFTRLPIRSVFICRSVSKTWRSLIDNPRFRHLSSTPPYDPSSSSLLVFPYRGYSLRTRSVYIIAEDDATSLAFGGAPISRADFQFSDVAGLDLLGCVNGLLLFTCSAVVGELFFNRNPNLRLFVCNPATQEYAQLPNSEFCSPKGSQSFQIIPGFGFDPSTNKFKVVLICSWWYYGGRSEVEARVYTFGSHLWRRLRNLPKFYGVSLSSVYLNSSVHWMFGILDDSFRIVSFDMEHETFEVIPLPPCDLSWNPDTSAPDDFLLREIGGRLCLSDCSSPSGNCEIWILLNYDDKRSWNKELVLPIEGYSGMYPVSFRRDGEVVLVRDRWWLVSFNLQTRIYTSVVDEQVIDWDSNSFCAVYPYVVSLTSPKSICTIE